MPALHAARKAATLPDTGDVDELASLEIFHQPAVADFRFVFRFRDANFLHDFHRSHVSLFEVAGHCLVDALRLDEFDEAELRGVVAVFFLGPGLHDDAGARLENGATHEDAVFGEDLRHAELDSDDSVDCHFPFLSLVACPPPADIGCVTSEIRCLKPAGLKPGIYIYFPAWPKALISTSTPGGRSSFISASTVSGGGSRISIRRLCVRISNCSRDFLST